MLDRLNTPGSQIPISCDIFLQVSYVVKFLYMKVEEAA